MYYINCSPNGLAALRRTRFARYISTCIYILHIYIYTYIYIYIYIYISHKYKYIRYRALKTMIVRNNIKHISTIGLAAAVGGVCGFTRIAIRNYTEQQNPRSKHYTELYGNPRQRPLDQQEIHFGNTSNEMSAFGTAPASMVCIRLMKY